MGQVNGTAYWGSTYWRFLKIACEGTPNWQDLVTLVYAYAAALPCEECHEHFGQILKLYPPEVAFKDTGREDARRLAWFRDVRDAVRKYETPTRPLVRLQRNWKKVAVVATVAVAAFLLGAIVVSALAGGRKRT